MKGAYLNRMYPHFGMRIVSDADILYNLRYRREVRDYFLGRGYTAEHYGFSNDAYLKPPLYNFEMHRYLIGNSLGEEVFAYYCDIKDRLLPDSGCGYGYHFSDEDFYVYSIVNVRKDFVTFGTGLRALADNYVIRRTAARTIDTDYIKRELGKLRLTGFEKAIRQLSHKLFSNPGRMAGRLLMNQAPVQLGEREKELFVRFAASGIFGRKSNLISNQVTGNNAAHNKALGKFVYVCKRIFPPKHVIIAEESAMPGKNCAWPILYPVRFVRIVGRYTKDPAFREMLAGELKALHEL